MTEEEWLNCTDPQRMLEFLKGKASDRKLRLFAVACCRCVWHLLHDDRSREAVRVAELCADGLASVAELKAVSCFENAYALVADDGAAVACFHPFGCKEATVAAQVLFTRGMSSPHPSALLRDIFGNPFHPSRLAPAWVTWNEGAAVRLAQFIYEERAFDRLPILADALEEAGCTDADILGHCRSEGPHIRGCWVVDLLLGKE